MRILDTLCAGLLFIVSIVYSLLVPIGYTGRIWIFGTCLALLFVAMLNLLRIRNHIAVRHLKLFCITANLAILAFVISLMASIGGARTIGNLEVPFIAVLVLIETVFSVASVRPNRSASSSSPQNF